MNNMFLKKYHKMFTQTFDTPLNTSEFVLLVSCVNNFPMDCDEMGQPNYPNSATGQLQLQIMQKYQKTSFFDVLAEFKQQMNILKAQTEASSQESL